MYSLQEGIELETGVINLALLVPTSSAVDWAWSADSQTPFPRLACKPQAVYPAMAAA